MVIVIPACGQWKIGAEMVRVCGTAGLIKLFPTGEEGGCPGDGEVPQQLCDSDPEQLDSANADKANIWVCTCFMGTRQCQPVAVRA
ncbi:hypothetical protein EGJ34_03895 [Stenotrophomonas sp. 278]|nr:hypothetical protein EGJ34_03895 [Stenotrophomonas sp. 278]